MSRPRKPYDLVKRSIDIVGSALGLVVLSPVFVVVALTVWLKLGSPVLFRQDRPGRDGKIFTLYKFRSMLDEDPATGRFTDDQRMTSFGSTLRATSLDELPSLLNVLGGQMSLVGPRPLKTEYLQHYSARQARRHEVLPGITGLAQISGRNSLDWQQRLELDVNYVEARSFILDLKILCKTVAKVFSRGDVAADGLTTVEMFVGNPPDDGLIEKSLNDRIMPVELTWIRNPEDRNGNSIGSGPSFDAQTSGEKAVATRERRRDWVYCNGAHHIVAVAGLYGVGTTELSLYMYGDPALHDSDYSRLVMNRLIYRARSYDSRRLYVKVPKTHTVAASLCKELGFSLAPEAAAQPDDHEHYVLHLQGDD